MWKSPVTFVTLSLVVILYASDGKGEEQPVVRTPLGEMKGYYMQTRGGRQVSAFTAIPYAVPPLGHLRFKVGTYNSIIAQRNEIT